jgi:FlaA1/EpsC-like NDP-sugar epimerase
VIFSGGGLPRWQTCRRLESDVNEPHRGTTNLGKRVLVTGAGGCIGSALAEALCSNDGRQLILLDHSEQNLYEISMRLTALGRGGYAAILGDILDEALLEEIFERHRPDTIYHAAAFKHVPLMESNPLAVVRNNAIGTWELAKAAAQFGVERVLMISTDKAVNPRSVMGASKRVAELALLRMSNSKTRMNAVRLGNVLGSQGSVTPLFQQQIAQGGPVTVTHPEARRYFLTLGETVELILAANALEEPGCILVPKMSTPVKILDLAKRMIEEAGLQTPRDVAIAFTGLRPGDKLEEELIFAQESLAPTSEGRLRRAQGAPVDAEVLDPAMGRIAAGISERNLSAVIDELGKLVPGYQPSETMLGLLNPSMA